METPKSSTFMSVGANYVHRRVNIQIGLIGRHIGAKTNITKLLELKTCCLMMPNHIQHSSQVVGYHNQLHLLHQSIV